MFKGYKYKLMELTGIFRFRKYITILFLPSQRIWE